jgi:hypothetical protein
MVHMYEKWDLDSLEIDAIWNGFLGRWLIDLTRSGNVQLSFLFLSTRTLITACNWLSGRLGALRGEWDTKERERRTVTSISSS